MDGLRSEDYAEDDDVDQVAMAEKDDALKLLYTKLTKLPNEGLRHFVEEVLPALKNSDVLICTFQSCPGPRQCRLKSSQPHDTKPSLSSRVC